VLREPDAGHYDAAAVVQYMKSSACNTLIVNAGGIVDFFQNPLPAANLNRFMGDRDILKEITQACRAEGIRVVGRIDFRGVEEKIYRQHPDWFSVDVNKQPLQLSYTRPQLYAACYTGHYRNAHAEAFIRYLFENYALDGVWHNSIGISGICYCTHCEAAYRASTGDQLPDPATATDEQINRYMLWKTKVAAQHMEHMKKTVKSFGDDKVYTAEVFSMFEAGGKINSGIDLYNARDHFDFLVSVAFLTENTDHIEYQDLTYAGTIVRFLKSMAPEKEAIILYGGNGTSHRYVMDPTADLDVYLWEALSAGGRFWNCSFTGMHPAATYDRRNAFQHRETYQFVRDHEKVLSNQVPIADAGIYYSRPTRLFYRNHHDDFDSFEGSIKGVEISLIERHIPYDFIPEDQVDAHRLARYKVIILPNVKCLSAAEVQLLNDYVAAGGKLLATFECGYYNENGVPQKDQHISNLLGCRFTGEKVNTRKDCYQFIVDPSHTIVKPDSDLTELFINAGFTLLCEPLANARVICSYVPVVHNQPPEKAWTTEWARKYPTILENRLGKGLVLYYCNQPDQISYDMGHPDMRNLLGRGISYLLGDNRSVTTNAPESVHIGLTRSLTSPNEFIFSMVNTTSGPRRPVRTLLPVFNLTASLKLERTMNKFSVLRAQGPVTVSGKGNEVSIKVDQLTDFFALHLTTTG
jgi:hypothetical protein